MVNWNFALWRPVTCKSRKGNLVEINWARNIDCHYQGLLLKAILKMPQKCPISLEKALVIISEKKNQAFAAGDIGSKPGQYSWYSANFVSYISDMGFHIELTGDEIESIGPSEIRT
ncbi:MAG: hypothetical protein AB7F86_11420 [Bdellovibrionales bacterium]